MWCLSFLKCIKVYKHPRSWEQSLSGSSVVIRTTSFLCLWAIYQSPDVPVLNLLINHCVVLFLFNMRFLVSPFFLLQSLSCSGPLWLSPLKRGDDHFLLFAPTVHSRISWKIFQSANHSGSTLFISVCPSIHLLWVAIVMVLKKEARQLCAAAMWGALMWPTQFPHTFPHRHKAWHEHHGRHWSNTKECW